MADSKSDNNFFEVADEINTEKLSECNVDSSQPVAIKEMEANQIQCYSCGHKHTYEQAKSAADENDEKLKPRCPYCDIIHWDINQDN